jgi:hypothetical protein
MKRILTAGLLAVAVLAGTHSKASANFNCCWSLSGSWCCEWSGFCCSFSCRPNPCCGSCCSSCCSPCCYCPPAPYTACCAPGYGGYLPPGCPAGGCDLVSAGAYGYGGAPAYAAQPYAAPQSYGGNPVYPVGYAPQAGYGYGSGAVPAYWYGY